MARPKARPGLPPTLRDLRRQTSWIWVHGSGCACTHAIPLYPFVERFGLDSPAGKIAESLRCRFCAAHPATMSIPSWDARANLRSTIPLERVPPTLRGWALIDPAGQPAPARGRSSLPAPSRAAKRSDLARASDL